MFLGDKSNTPLNKCPIFIVGAPRSGTTWVLELLIRHRSVFHLTSRDVGLTELDSDWPGIPSKETQLFWRCKPKEAGDRVMRSQEIRKRRAVEKTPSHVFHLRTINNLWSNALPVIIYRNPWDVVVSLTEAGKTWAHWAPSSIEDAALMWNHYVTPSIEYKGSKIEILYKDLKEKTQSEVKKILENENLSASSSEIVRIIRKTKEGKTLKKMKGFFRKGIVGDYKKVLTKEEIKNIKKITLKNFLKIVKKFPSAEEFLSF